LRIKHKEVLIVFTQRRTLDKYIIQSINKGFIITPGNKPFVEDKTLFLFDDLTPLGISYPKDLVETLKEQNPPSEVYNAQELASKLVPLLPKAEATVLSGGGVLTYLFLKREGYNGNLGNIIQTRREYVEGKPECSVIGDISLSSLVIDDILASGQTLCTTLNQCSENETEFACLLASSNVPKGEKGYRNRQRTTISGIRRLYCPQFVNGIENRKPAILSLRYLLTKATDNGDYYQGYLQKKFGGEANIKRILDLVKEINREPIDLLRTDPLRFLKTYGGY